MINFMLPLQIYFHHKFMTDTDIEKLAAENQARAKAVLDESGISRIWADAGCRVNLVGSLKMGLLMTHRDIDLHVYSGGITEQKSFTIASRMAIDPRVTEMYQRPSHRRALRGVACDIQSRRRDAMAVRHHPYRGRITI